MSTHWQHMIELWRSKQLEREHRPQYASKRSAKLQGKGCGMQIAKNARIVSEKLNPELGLNSPKR